MTAYNVVRFQVKAGREKEFIELHKAINRSMKGLRKVALIKTGERVYCFVGEWDGMPDLVAARPAMIANLDQMRPLLDDLGHGMGVTDAVSGEAVVELP